jgi:gliding motility-associated-like protein
VFEKPRPAFSASQVCSGTATQFTDGSTLNPLNGESIVLREWDFSYDGVTFQKEGAFDNQLSFAKDLGGAGVYQVALRITTNQTGCSAMVVVPVVVNELPQSQFVASSTEGCSILSVTFTNSVSNQPITIQRYQWEVDEGAGFVVVDTQDPALAGFTGQLSREFDNTTTTNKEILVRLRAIATTGCEQLSPVLPITVYPGTASGFSSVDYSPFASNCSPQTIHFNVDDATQALNPTNYQWQVYAGGTLVRNQSSGSVPDFSFTFENTGLVLQDFDIKLTTTLASGCFGDSTRTVRIAPNPSSKFKVDTLEYTCEIVRIRVEAEQRGLASYQWRMTENGITTIQSSTLGDSFEHAFVRSSSVDVAVEISLNTVNLANCPSVVTSQTLTVTKVDGISAFFTATPGTQTLPSSTVQLAAITPGPWQYKWDFGDGATSSRPALESHTYNSYGTYVITLTVSNLDCSTAQSQSVTVLLPAPIIDFDFEPSFGCAPLKVSFLNKTQFGEADQYLWTFGDGQATSSAVDPTYTYNEPGKYSVTLRATNATGQTSQLTKENIIEVYPVPSAQFDVKPQLITGTDGLLYTSNRSFGATEFSWDFGDGTTSTEREPVHTYRAEGEFEVELIARNSFNCADTARLAGGVKVRNGGNLLVPNAFSPNLSGSIGDGGGSGGKNDVFLPLLRGVTNFEMLIFNRWGELLFQSTSPSVGWDGYYQGRLCQQDVYVYRITAEFETGEKLVKVGDVNLIR